MNDILEYEELIEMQEDEIGCDKEQGDGEQFDFRSHYEKGQIIYYVYVNDYIGTKELFTLSVRTILPTTIICSNTKSAESVCIDTRDRGMVFNTLLEAEDVLKETEVRTLQWSNESKSFVERKEQTNGVK